MNVNDISTKEALLIIRDITLGMKYCYEKFNIMHRDLKPDNILKNNNTFKIADFGFASNESIKNSFLGTPLYMCPQTMTGGNYTYKCDIWSIGVILYELMLKKTPWYSDNIAELRGFMLTQ